MPTRSATRQRPDIAAKMIEYDVLEDKLTQLGMNNLGASDFLEQQAVQLEELFEAAALDAEDTTIIQKDANVFRAFLNARNAQSNPVTSTFLRVLDGQELQDGFKRLIELHGLEKALQDVAVQHPNRSVFPATVPRGFHEAVTRQMAPREKKMREEGPAKQTVAFDQERQQNNEARAIKAIKNHFKKRYLQERVPLSYYQFVLNRNSFVHTVENVFYFSFLVRDNYVEVFKGDDILDTKIRPLFRRPGDAETPPAEEGEREDDPYDEELDETDPFIVEGCDEDDYVQKTSGTRLLFLPEMEFSLWQELCERFPDGGIPSRRESDECQYTRGAILPEPRLLSPPLTN